MSDIQSTLSRKQGSVIDEYKLPSIRDFGYPKESQNHYGIYEDSTIGIQDDDDDQLYDQQLPSWELIQQQQFKHLQQQNPSDSVDLQNVKLILLYSFEPENENELKIVEDQVVMINYKYNQGWLVANDLETGEVGLIPQEYVQLIFDDGDHEVEELTPYLPKILQDDVVEGNESDWVDE